MLQLERLKNRLYQIVYQVVCLFIESAFLAVLSLKHSQYGRCGLVLLYLWHLLIKKFLALRKNK